MKSNPDLAAAKRELAEQCALLSDANLRILIASWPGTKAAEAAEDELARRKRERKAKNE